ncbi:kinase-like domain-containing protein [Glomus cerebriforme]|uniref:Kinase-like domain-containing protein n=1 Tax=Glomus cerebriforme TaxID=658196 RepID=A0A397S0U3_9GLOM|nr:kinase-like domain-containing protein [Glomus cerebriforme]RIA79170.1 kinase-like domain-containing protein [Glomus cerebriforme]
MKETFSSFDTSGSAQDHGMQIIQTAADVVKNLGPHFEIAISISTYILEIYDKAKTNKKICRVFADRVDLALTSIKYLRRHIDKDFEKFQEKSYFESFMHFIEVLENIKKFIEDVSEINGFKKFFVANVVNQQLNYIRDDFDHCYKSLQLAIAIDDVINREKENDDIKNDMNQLKGYYEDIKENFHLTDQKLSIIAAKIETLEKNSSILDKSKPPEIDMKELLDPEEPVYRNSIILKKYRTFNVACKPIKYSLNDDNPDSKKVKATLAIWNELGDCPYIIKFRGTSHLDGYKNIIVLDWADFGDLKTLYENMNLDWKLKLSMARDIFRGLCFLNHIRVLHHDVRCENVLVFDKFQCKITNFTLSHKTEFVTTKLFDNDNDKVIRMLPWMAPEKLKGYQKSNQQNKKIEPYTYACEMFSFGMLLWELSFNRIPYKNMEYDEIIEHVLSGKRETLDFENCPRDIFEGFTEIIKLAWQHDNQKRPTNQKVLKILESLYKSHENNSLSLSEETNNESQKSLSITSTISNDFVNVSENSVKHKVLDILPLSKGIEHHNTKAKKTKSEQDYRICWECFKAHSDIGNKTAMYWKGLYLWKGFVEKDQIEAKKLFKKAADAGIADAQLEYAFAYDSKNLKNPELPFNRKECLKYLTMAAENNNPTALYHLGISYYNGKMGLQKDEEKGIEYLKLSALSDNSKAIEALEKYEISL